MSSLLILFLLSAADPAAAPAAMTAPAQCPRSDGVLHEHQKARCSANEADEDCDMAIDEVGMPVDKKDKKGKGVLKPATGPVTGGMARSSDPNAACGDSAAGGTCPAAKAIINTSRSNVKGQRARPGSGCAAREK
ncbi:MAG TPA: hypothetical protein VGB59_01670 [Allosphingosinicella sp.]|jgi:hypothetical protein